MDEIHAHTNNHVRSMLQTALGSAHRIASLTRLRGGTKKGVYRAVLDDRSVIVYVWDTSENYWPAGDPDVAPNASDPFADASGADLFAVSNQYLQSLGVRTPELYHLDTSRAASPADIAIVEDIQGGTIEEHWQRQPDDAARITSELGEMLRTIHARRNSRFGKLASVDNQAPQDVRCEQLALRRALDHLDHAAAHIDRLREVHKRLEETLRSMAAGIPLRSEYGLIHGELGPDHVLVDAQGHPAIIDIEGLMFFDVEWEQHTPSWSSGLGSTTGICGRTASTTRGFASTRCACMCPCAQVPCVSLRVTSLNGKRCWELSDGTSRRYSTSSTDNGRSAQCAGHWPSLGCGIGQGKHLPSQ